MSDNDWSNPPYYSCGYCSEKWSIALLGRDEAGRRYEEHAQTEPCKTKRETATAEWKERSRTRIWEFDHYVGSTRAKELGLWQSNKDPNRTWTVTGTVTVEQMTDDDGTSLTIEADGQKLTIKSFRDQWGTWHQLQSGKGGRHNMVAQEDGTRSFLRALIAGLQHLEPAADYQTRDPTEREVRDETGGSGDRTQSDQ